MHVYIHTERKQSLMKQSNITVSSHVFEYLIVKIQYCYPSGPTLLSPSLSEKVVGNKHQIDLSRNVGGKFGVENIGWRA